MLEMVSMMLRRPLLYVAVFIPVAVSEARVRVHAAVTAHRPAESPDFFTEDERKLAEMPPYAPDPQGDPELSSICEPRCLYTCGTKECDQVCEPMCAPPQCETVCTKSADKCETRCGPPRCAVVCPSTSCRGGNCPKCRTVCSPPACTTECTDDCKSVCSKPSCTWSCHVGKCPKPDCKMNCVGTRRCRSGLPPPRSAMKVPRPANSKVVSEGVASLDPTVLATPPTPPPAVTLPPPSADLEAAQEKLRPITTTMGPVEALKKKWQAEDYRTEEMRLLRR
mmetsp:Transcript_138156/g.257790  ORF Transcript_138156/g.257790 Transcript_138156/m.257790 type:complete len:280 (+) Transcript_138156:130-969(+)